MNPNIQPVASKVHEMILSHPLALDNLAPALMNFYTGMSISSGHFVCIAVSRIIGILSNYDGNANEMESWKQLLKI